MRGRKEILGSMKEETRSRGRTVGQTNVKGSVKTSGRTVGSVGSGHGGLSLGSRKTTAGKGGTHK